ncbi:MAG: NADH:flavin oxidoreductase [Armatimonadetes bacterium]|nr:NADH:flavin oxidoreductase [Armatimonadota bacterium]
MAHLLDPVHLGSVRVPNRIAMPPMVRLAPHVRPDLLQTEGVVTEALIDHYRKRAEAGTGLVIVEATAVDPSGRVWKQGLNAYDASHLDGLRALASAIVTAGAVPGIQLVHGGPQADPNLFGGVAVGPSATPPSIGELEPRELDIATLLHVQGRFVEAAALAADAGFRVIEAHGAHGYLLDSFISPVRNRRTDAFGGSLENRMRMAMDIVLRMKARVGDRVAVGCRISVFNHIADGFGHAELVTMVRCLEQAGSDFVDLSVDRVLRESFGTMKSMGQLAREATRLPVLVAGGLSTPHDADRAIAEGHGDIACVGRAMLANPAWAGRAIEELRAH